MISTKLDMKPDGIGYGKKDLEGAMDFLYGKLEKPHYQSRGGIEPIDFIVSNGMDFLEGNVIKYIYRYPQKGGLSALEKAQDYLRILIEREVNKGAANE